MARPLLALAFVFALVVVGAGALMLRSDRDVAPLAANLPAEAPPAAAAGTDASTAAPEAGSEAQTAAADPAAPDAPPATRPAEEPATSAGAPAETAAPPAPNAGVVASAPAAGAAEPAMPASPDAEPDGAALPAFDVVRVEPDGSALIAGRAEPGAAVEILSAGEVIATAVADAEGAFIAIPAAPLAPGSHGLSLRVVGEETPAGPQRQVTVAALPGSAATKPGVVDTEAPPTVSAEPPSPAAEEQQVAAAEPKEAPLPQTQPSQGPETTAEAGPPPAATAEPQPSAKEQVAAAEPGDASATPFPSPQASGEIADVEAGRPADALTPSGPTTAESVDGASGLTPSEPRPLPSADADADVSVMRPGAVEEEPTSGAPDSTSGTAAADGDDTHRPTNVAPAESASATEDSDQAAVGTDLGTTKDAPRAPQAPRRDEEIAGLQPPQTLDEEGGEESERDSGSSPAPAVSDAPAGSAEDSRPASGDPLAAGEPDTPSVAPDDKPPSSSREVAELTPPPEPAGDADQTGIGPSSSSEPEAADVARAEAAGAQGLAGGETAPPAETAESGEAPAPKAEATQGLADLQYAPVLPRFESGEPGQDEASTPAAPTEVAPEGKSEAVTKQIAAASESETAPSEQQLTVPRLSVKVAPQKERVHVSAKATALPPEIAAPQISIKAAEVENDNLYVAGEAKPGTIVRLMADDIVIAEVETGNGGHWLVEAQRDIPLGRVTLRADIVGADAATPTAQAELPFTRYADGVVLEPVVAAVGDDAEVALDAKLPPPALVIIRRGDNLWRISRRNYGRGIKYKSIFAANRDQIRNPHRIYPGQVFLVPTRDRSWTSAVN